MYLHIGNRNAIEGYRKKNFDEPETVHYRALKGDRVDEPETVHYRALKGDRVTEIVFPEGTSVLEAFRTTIAALQHHMEKGAAPSWIEGDNDDLLALLGMHYGIDVAGRPEGYGEDTGVPQYLGLTLPVMLAIFAGTMLALRTDAGRDFMARVMGDTSSTGTGSYAAANYIGLTANATAASAGDTTLTGEITSGTLARAQGTYAHTNGTATYTITKTFTSDQSVTIAKVGYFNHPTAGTMVFETVLATTAVLVSGDQLAITSTVTL